MHVEDYPDIEQKGALKRNGKEQQELVTFSKQKVIVPNYYMLDDSKVMTISHQTNQYQLKQRIGVKSLEWENKRCKNLGFYL